MFYTPYFWELLNFFGLSIFVPRADVSYRTVRSAAVLLRKKAKRKSYVKVQVGCQFYVRLCSTKLAWKWYRPFLTDQTLIFGFVIKTTHFLIIDRENKYCSGRVDVILYLPDNCTDSSLTSALAWSAQVCTNRSTDLHLHFDTFWVAMDSSLVSWLTEEERCPCHH